MGILKGSLGARRYTTDITLLDLDGDLIAKALDDHAFNMERAERLKPNEAVYGWTHSGGESVDFSGGDRPWANNHYLVFELREDLLKIPSGPLKRQLGKLKAKWCEENGRVRCPSGVARELKETVEIELAAKVLPTTKITEVLWDTANGVLYVHTFADKWLDKIRTYFRNTFGVMVEAIPSISLMDKFDPELASDIEQHVDSGDVTTHKLAGEFYLWLTINGLVANDFRESDETHNGGVAANVIGDLWVKDQITLESGEGGESTTIKGDSPHVPEVRESLHQGKNVSELVLHLRREEREYTATLKGIDLDLKALKLPAHNVDGDGELVYERMYLVEDFYECLNELFRSFLSHRLNPDVWGRWSRIVRDWVAGDDDVICTLNHGEG